MAIEASKAHKVRAKYSIPIGGEKIMKRGTVVVVCAAFLIAGVSAYGEEVFLGDLTPESSLVHGGLKVDKDYYNETIKMDGEEYEKGIVMHVKEAEGFSEVIYEVSGYKTFRADIGLSHRDAPPAGSVVFFLYIDDGKGVWTEKYTSDDVITHETQTIQLEIDISGAKELRLYCTDAGNGINSDHATWANARVDTASMLAVKRRGRLTTTWGAIKTH